MTAAAINAVAAADVASVQSVLAAAIAAINGQAFDAGGGGGGDAVGARFWRLNVTANDGSSFVGMAEWQMYTSTDGTGTSFASTGTASQTGDGAVGEAAAMIDDNTGSPGGSSFASPYILTVDLGIVRYVRSIGIVAEAANGNRSPTSFTVQYSDDNSTWTTAQTVIGSTGWANGERRAYTVRTGALPDLTPTAGASTYHTSNLVAYLDASETSSYGGSGQTWANLVSSPADGSGQTAYDFYLGSGSGSGGDDPTFNGTAGNQSINEFFSFDGGDFFTLALGTSGPQFLKDMHKSGQAWTIEVWMERPNADASNVAPMFDTGTSDQGGADMSRGAIVFDLGNLQQTPGRQRVRIKQDSGGGVALSTQSDWWQPKRTPFMAALSYSAGGSSFFYLNGRYDRVSGADTFTATLTSPSSSNPVNAPRIGARGDGSFAVPSGTRIYLMRIYNAALSKAQLDTNFNGTKARFGAAS